MELASNSRKQMTKFRRSHDEDVAKLWEESHKEKASRDEAWRILEEEHRVHEEDLESGKVALKLVIDEEKGLRIGLKRSRVSSKKLKSCSARLRPISTRPRQRSALL